MPAPIRVEAAAAIARNGGRLVADEADPPRAVNLSLALKHRSQDCLYLALAERGGATLTTAGGKFTAKN